MKLKYNILKIVGNELRVISFDKQDDYYEMWECKFAADDTKKEKYDFFKATIKKRFDKYATAFPFFKELNNLSFDKFNKIFTE